MYKIILFVAIGLTIVKAQDDIENYLKIQINGGIGYLFNNEHTNTFGGYTEIDKKLGVITGIKLKYLLNDSNILTIGAEFIKAKTVAKNMLTNTEWTFNGYPISVGYQYNFPKLSLNLYPYISTDVAYYISSEKIIQSNKDEGLTETFNRTESGFGVDGNVGLIYSISYKIEVMTELMFRYSNASIFTEDTKYSSIEFTGIYFNLGLIYNF